MGLWSKIKKEVSRIGRKAGLDRNSKSWGVMATGTATGALSGLALGGPWGALAGGIIGAGSGMVAGDSVSGMDEAAKTAEKQQERALELASRTEIELSGNNSAEADIDAAGDLRRKRLAASYSLSQTSAFAPKKTAGKSTIG